MKKIKLIIQTLILLSSIIVTSQVVVYNTFNDYENGTGQEFDDFKNPFASGTLFLLKNNIKTSIKCKNIWGFHYKNYLFRIDQNKGEKLPVIVISKGKLIYYENGMAYVRMLYKGEDSSYYDGFDGYSAYISMDINSPIVPIAKGTNAIDKSKAKKRRENFKKEHPEFNAFFDCLRNLKIETVRRCIANFEGYDSK